MNVNLETQFTNLVTGKPLTDETSVPVTLKSVLINALLTLTEDDRGLSGKEKLARHQLAEKVSRGDGHVELSVSDVAKCLELTGKLYPPSIVGPVFAALDPKPIPHVDAIAPPTT